MQEKLKELGYIDASQDGVIGYYKTYKGFRLFVGCNIGVDRWFACLTIGRIEIMIPGVVNDEWLVGFDKENEGW